MALIIDIAGKHLAYGMHWAAVAAGRGESGRVSDLGNRFKASHKLRLAVPGGSQYGFLEGGGRAPRALKRGALVSAAALFLANVPRDQDSILIYLFDGKKKAAIIALMDGMVYQDVVIPLGNGLEKSDSGTMLADGSFDVPVDGAVARIRDRVDQIHNETGRDFVPYGNYFHGFPQSAPMGPEELLVGATSAAALARFTDPRPVLKVLAGGAVLALAMIGWRHHQESERKRKELEAQQSQVDPMQAYRSNLPTALASLGFGGANAEHALATVLLAREVEQGGWLMAGASCKNDGKCKEKWVQANGTSDSFVAANQLGKATFADDLRTIINDYQIKVQPKALRADTLPTLDLFWQAWTDRAQGLAMIGVLVKAGAAPSVDFALPPGVLSSMITPGQGVARAEFEMIGPLGVMREVLAGLPDNVMVSELSVTTADQLDSDIFSIKGFYYVKK